MTAVFADTSFYLALLSTDDEFHDRAVQLSLEMRRPIVVTEFVLLETGNSLSSVNQRRLFVELLPHLQAQRCGSFPRHPHCCNPDMNCIADERTRIGR
jgi:predicted nucleic acid-binding protein